MTTSTTQIPPLDPVLDQFPNNPPRLLLIGPPGTGKTRACLETFLLPALTTGTSPSEILSCSFTRAAAGELRERLARATGCSTHDLRPTCSTIHAEALRRLRAGGREVKILSGRTAKDEPEDSTGDASTAWARELVKEIELEVIGAAQSVWHLARARCRREQVAAIAAEVNSEYSADELIDAIAKYERAKAEKGVLDFTDLLELALKENAPPRALLVVDEVQDCSELQWRLIDHWAEKAESLVLVGDQDQTIHEWCGASYDRFSDAMRGCELRRLTKSFRVPEILHRKARSVIRRVADRVDAPYEPADAAGEYRLAMGFRELETLVRQAFEAGARSAFVLAPTVNACVGWFSWFLQLRIPARCERGSVPDPFSWSRKSFARALAALREGREAPAVDVEHLVGQLPVRGTGLFTGTKKAALERVAELVKTRALTWEAAGRAGVNLEPLRAAESLTAAAALAKLDDEGFRALVRLLEKLGPAVLDDAFRPAVTITTWHGSKGREADLVVADLSRSRFVEHQIAAGHRDRWLRALYVVFTRARKSLIAFEGHLENVIAWSDKRL